jgi:hypothetical protein
MSLGEIGLGVEWIKLAQDRDRWRSLVKFCGHGVSLLAMSSFTDDSLAAGVIYPLMKCIEYERVCQSYCASISMKGVGRGNGTA